MMLLQVILIVKYTNCLELMPIKAIRKFYLGTTDCTVIAFNKDVASEDGLKEAQMGRIT